MIKPAYTKGEWNIPPPAHSALPAIVSPQIVKQVVGPPPTRSGCRVTATSVKLIVRLALPDSMQAAGPAVNVAGPEPRPPTLLPPGQQHPSHDTPCSLPLDNGSLINPTARLPVPTSTSIASFESTYSSVSDKFVKRDSDRQCSCLWTDGHGSMCGYSSHHWLVKRHIQRVHFEIKYVPQF